VGRDPALGLGRPPRGLGNCGKRLTKKHPCKKQASEEAAKADEAAKAEAAAKEAEEAAQTGKIKAIGKVNSQWCFFGFSNQN
jgi:hypothetical protein